MNQLKIEMANCFGIRQFSNEFEFEPGQNTILIYAPNGTMKTSFAKAMLCKSGNAKKLVLADRFHSDRTAVCDVFADGASIAPGDIFVVDAEDLEYDSSKYCSTILASQDLKDRYDAIYRELNDAVKRYTIDMGHEVQSSDCHDEIIRTFKTCQKDSFLDCLLSLKEQADGVYTLYSFKYNDVFDNDKTTKIRDFIAKFRPQLEDYITRYNELLENSVLYRKVGDCRFGTHQANELQKSVSDGSFFGVQHKIILSGNIPITTIDEWNDYIEQDRQRLLSDAGLRRTFDQITKAIDANGELRAFKNVIEQDPGILVGLADYDGFKKEFWLGHLFSADNRERTKALIALYETKLEDVRSIVAEAAGEQEKWKKIIELYKTRFYVPFEVRITNQEDVLLKNDVASLQFVYHDGSDEVVREKKELLSILSKGEQRAMYILQMLFEVEGRRLAPNEQLLVFDDIADSFDYQNKYAIIEYIRDLHRDSTNHFKCILLTHNFDFYRTVSARLNLRKNAFFAERQDTGEVTLSTGAYRYATPFSLSQRKCCSNDRHYLCMIPFVRNIVEYQQGTSSADYLKLTSCLHLKSDTRTIQDNDVSAIIRSYMGGEAWSRVDRGESIFDMIQRVADEIEANHTADPMFIADKVVLSMAIRLLAEKYMINHLLSSGVSQAEIDSISDNQERKLKEKCEGFGLTLAYDVLERVNMMTPENIHLNSFMYEPLVDMSMTHLLQLYADCKGLR